MRKSSIVLILLSGFASGTAFTIACGDSETTDAAVDAAIGTCECPAPAPLFDRVIQVSQTETKSGADNIWNVAVGCPSTGTSVRGRVVSVSCDPSSGVALAGFETQGAVGACTWLKPSGPAEATLTARALCYYPEGTPLPTVDGGQ